MKIDKDDNQNRDTLNKAIKEHAKSLPSPETVPLLEVVGISINGKHHLCLVTDISESENNNGYDINFLIICTINNDRKISMEMFPSSSFSNDFQTFVKTKKGVQVPIKMIAETAIADSPDTACSSYAAQRTRRIVWNKERGFLYGKNEIPTTVWSIDPYQIHTIINGIDETKYQAVLLSLSYIGSMAAKIQEDPELSDNGAEIFAMIDAIYKAIQIDHS